MPRKRIRVPRHARAKRRTATPHQAAPSSACLSGMAASEPAIKPTKIARMVRYPTDSRPSAGTRVDAVAMTL
eukprot:5552333-Prymnesium_polylepis.1